MRVCVYVRVRVLACVVTCLEQFRTDTDHCQPVKNNANSKELQNLTNEKFIGLYVYI